MWEVAEEINMSNIELSGDLSLGASPTGAIGVFLQ